MSEAELVYASIALLIGVIKLLLDHRRNETLEGTRQAVLLVYQSVQDLESSIQDGCNDLAWTINEAMSNEDGEEEKEGKAK